MSRWICLLLLVCATAHAAPHNNAATSATDDLDRFLIDRQQVLNQLRDVRASVQDRTGELISTAMGFLGVPYRRGGNTADSGFDCSGFIRAIYGQTIGLALPRRANEQAAATETIDKKDLQPGDLVFFNTMRRAYSHVGLYLGDGKFIHSPRSGAEVRVEDMSASYWQRRFNGARRVLSEDQSASGVQPSASAQNPLN
ncbi:C40 family peptidase [Paracidovorax citrulli]|nr:C40 family peptidase [Paracidovorax citrulli]ATG92683.1 glycoside hydrolase [Paracidovorax citrulli]UEG48392.1 C40 family peptidase [Paracidovorax citrulli]UMT86369.1 NlpC/P60 family protein [Paracidovorax citrulli]UMT90699.1 NlpC/P60 family protein [Paracidovorax citrulli]UMT97764.1 NlpC/P60 family protein [Paracidovorax citrulli]